MSETILLALAEWSIRTTILAGAVGALLWAARIKNAQIKLTAWTIVLAAALLMPLAAPLAPRLSIPVPRFFAQEDSRKPQTQPAFELPAVPHSNASARKSYYPRATDIAAISWLLIALTMLFRLLLGLRLSARLVHGSGLVEGNIRESDLVRVPITVGTVRPVVILPPDWRHWPASKLRAVKAHEQGHVARHDPLRQLAASIYRSVAWFHPLAWWLKAELADLAEHASDDAAIAAVEDRVKYAEALLSFIERTPRRVQWEGVPMANRQTRMRRIDRVLDQTRELSRPANHRALAVLILAALPLIYLATATRPVWAQTPAASTPAQSSVSASVCGGSPTYANWLNQDVAYIITQPERQAFEHLSDQAECAHFVDQFWLRRDPTPGTPQNEFKEEHYRRIAFANQHFASERLQGSSTDRGRIYITYGPPDEIESHPSEKRQRPAEEGGGVTEAYPFDQWLYHHNAALGDDVLFEFVDASQDREYRLTLMGSPNDLEALRGKGPGRPAMFGPESGVYVEVNHNGTLFIATPVRGSSAPVNGKIVDRNGATVQAFDDVARSTMYGKWITSPLPPGQYVLHLEVNHDPRTVIFEVK
ncbi:MAG TPA: GWxTD domain-containing protein [Bryobacteraceae bacterium]|jgi:GWxTD domain-containing protein|nr:GWxTD domain-containing protein [Bryobacteraceae bacterium]